MRVEDLNRLGRIVCSGGETHAADLSVQVVRNFKRIRVRRHGVDVLFVEQLREIVVVLVRIVVTVRISLRKNRKRMKPNTTRVAV